MMVRLGVIAIAIAGVAVVGLRAASSATSTPCAPPTPQGGWAPWAYDEDGFKPYTMTLASALSTYRFEMPTEIPANFSVVTDTVDVIYMTGTDYTVHVLWQQPSRYATGETVVLYVRHGHPYDEFLSGSVHWSAPGDITYDLASADPDVGQAELTEMACSMPSFPGPCR
jgi:hypothetical protein